nr:MAG TPA: NTP-PPase-like protein [Caudoviricetes sp.]
MNANDYQQEALRTETIAFPVPLTEPLRSVRGELRLMNALMGLNGEAGEAIDVYKKYLFQGHDFDRVHLAKELGDVAWYLAVCADALGYTMDDIFALNVDKLRLRYPGGFDVARSTFRRNDDV